MRAAERDRAPLDDDRTDERLPADLRPGPAVAPRCYSRLVATISQRELRNDSGDVLRRVEAGEVVTVTRRGVPVADLVPHRPSYGPHRMAPTALITTALRDLPDWGEDAFEREQSDLDRQLDDSDRDPWRE